MIRRMRILPAILAAIVAILISGLACAQSGIEVDVVGPGQSKMNIAQAKPMGATAAEGGNLNEMIRRNLSFMPFFRMLSESDVLGGGSVGGATADQIDFKPFSLAKVDVLITSNWKGGSGLGSVELRAYEVFSQKLLLGKEYGNVSRDQIPEIADKFCAELIKLLTGRGDFFSTKIAFAKSSGKGKDIWICRPTGRDLTRITNYGDLGMAISPAWSPDGSRIAFTLIGSASHYLGVWSGGKPSIFTLPTSTVVSPRYTSGGELTASLNIGGKTDIYSISGSNQMGSSIVSGPGINVSASWDASGSVMAYVSDRTGSPGIYLRQGGSDRKISGGGYATNPSVSPDGKFVVYSKMVGGHKLMLYDIAAGSEKQISSGGGNDENPSFAPDSYFIVFSSTRGGGKKLYITTRNGDAPVMIPTGDGDAATPNWGPSPGGGK